MYEKIFSQVGLTEQEATIYEIMLELGETRAKEIYQRSPYKRGLVYKILDNLIEKNLLTRIEKPNAVSTFRVEHPDKINDLVEAEERKVRHYKKSIQSLMPELISNYNLAFNKPGIKFYEGEEGIKKVINDNLHSQTDVYTYADMEEVDKYIKKINDEYATKRDRLKLQKKILLVDSDYTKRVLETYQKSNIEIKFVKKASHFSTIMQIYDNKVSYVTLLPDKMIGVIINDTNIYQMHKTLFESMWETASF